MIFELNTSKAGVFDQTGLMLWATCSYAFSHLTLAFASRFHTDCSTGKETITANPLYGASNKLFYISARDDMYCPLRRRGTCKVSARKEVLFHSNLVAHTAYSGPARATMYVQVPILLFSLMSRIMLRRGPTNSPVMLLEEPKPVVDEHCGGPRWSSLFFSSSAPER